MNRIQRWTPSGIQARLDRRFARRDRVVDLEAEVAALDQALSAFGGKLEQSVKTLADTTAVSDARYQELAGRLDAVVSDAVAHMVSAQSAADALAERLGEVDVRSRRGADFVRDEDPHELRKKLFHSHQLARQAGEAIESLLQAELALWQEIDRLALEIRDNRSTQVHPIDTIEDE